MKPTKKHSIFDPDVPREQATAVRLGFVIAVLCALVTIVVVVRWL